MKYTIVIQDCSGNIMYLVECNYYDVEDITESINDFLQTGTDMGYDVDEILCSLDNELMDNYDCVVQDTFDIYRAQNI